MNNSVQARTSSTSMFCVGILSAQGHESHRGRSLHFATVGTALLFLAFTPACDRHDSSVESSAAGLAASGSGAAATAPPPASLARVEIPAILERSCREICDRSRRLNCENVAKCMPNCLAMGSLTPCTEKITTLYQCLVGQPVQNWACAPDGVAAIQKGFCDKEQGDTVACMEAKMR
jgi:hypothetical protein